MPFVPILLMNIYQCCLTVFCTVVRNVFKLEEAGEEALQAFAQFIP